MNPEKYSFQPEEEENSKETEPKKGEYIAPEKVVQYISETDGALVAMFNMAKRGHEDPETGEYVAWSDEEMENILDSAVKFLESKKKIYDRGEMPDDAALIQKQLDDMKAYSESLGEKTHEGLLKGIGLSLPPHFDQEPKPDTSERVEHEEDAYEDSAQEAERLWNEYEVLAKEYRELIDVLERNQKEQQKLLEESAKLLDESRKELEMGPNILDESDLRKRILNLQKNTEKQNEMTDSLIGIGGDIRGDLDVLRNHESKVDKITEQLKLLGEI